MGPACSTKRGKKQATQSKEKKPHLLRCAFVLRREIKTLRGISAAAIDGYLFWVVQIQAKIVQAEILEKNKKAANNTTLSTSFPTRSLFSDVDSDPICLDEAVCDFLHLWGSL
jgi:hypothetical protein